MKPNVNDVVLFSLSVLEPRIGTVVGKKNDTTFLVQSSGVVFELTDSMIESNFFSEDNA